MDKDDEELSNLDYTMAFFESIGFAVVYRRVNPADHGLPMTRNRLHFQGLDTRAVPNALDHLRNMMSMWDKLCGLLSPDLCGQDLEDFLNAESTDNGAHVSHEEILQWQIGSRDRRVMPGSEESKQMSWQRIHANVCEEHGVTCVEIWIPGCFSQ